MMTQQKKKSKLIQDYQLISLDLLLSDGGQLWKANHQLLKKHFSVKRIVDCPKSSQQDFQSIADSSGKALSGSELQVTILKRLNLSGCPRCHKMIKTTSAFYLVFDQFPTVTLQSYLKSHMDIESKLRLMLELTQLIEQIHSKGIVILGLSSSFLFIDKLSPFIADCSMAQQLSSKGKGKCQKPNGQIRKQTAPEYRNTGQFQFESDIYSLGIIFQKILGITDHGITKLQSCLHKMTSICPDNRPSLSQIIQILQSILSKSTDETFSPEINVCEREVMSIKKIDSNRNMLDFRQKNDLTLKVKTKTSEQYTRSKSPNNLTILSPTLTSKTTDKSFNQLTVQSPNVSRRTNSPVAQSSQSQKSQEKQAVKQLVKKLNKKRNLAFWLADLGQFAFTHQHPQLAYVLVKYAELTLRNVLVKLKNQKPKRKSHFELQIFYTKEVSQLQSLLKFLAKCVKKQNFNTAFEKQLTKSQQICQEYLKKLILAFSNSMNDKIDKDKNISQEKKTQLMTKTMMLLKRNQFGSYERWWNNIYQDDYLSIKNQPALKEQNKKVHLD